MSPQITVDILEADADTPVASIVPDYVVDGSVEDPIGDTGIGELSLGLDSPNRADIVKGRVLRWNGTGDEPFHSIIEAAPQVSLTESHSRVPRQVTIRGRGLLGQWDDARVQQWPGMRHDEIKYYTRHFNYASPNKCAAIDSTVYEASPVMHYDSNGQPVRSYSAYLPPPTWRDPGAKRICLSNPPGIQPVGRYLFRKTVTIAGGVIRHHAVADDRFLAWLGGVPILKCPDAPHIGIEETYATATWIPSPGALYDFVVSTENRFETEDGIVGGDISWLGYAAWQLPTTTSPLSASDLLIRSDNTWKGMDCHDTPTPGWTVPEILQQLLGEWQDLNQLTGWEIVDMDPGNWPEMLETNFETQKTTGVGVLSQLADGEADFATRVQGGAKQLLCYPFGTMGTYDTAPSSPPVFEDADITELSFDWVQA